MVRQNYGFENNFNEDGIKSVIEIDNKIKNEKQKINCDNEKVTRLMFEQLLRGINVTQNSCF